MNNEAIQLVVQARRALVIAKQRLQRHIKRSDVQLAFEDLSNQLWLVESKIVQAYYPHMAATGVFGTLGPPPVAPINIVRPTKGIHLTAFGSGLPEKAFAGVPADVPGDAVQRLRLIISRANRIRG